VARRIGAGRMAVVAAPDYLARHGEPRHPAELIDHQCLGYTAGPAGQSWEFLVDGRMESFPVRSRIHANNGDVLIEATARGLGLSYQPDFIAGDFVADGRVREILTQFPLPELGIYAILPSNRHVPQRVRALMDYLAAELAAPRLSGAATSPSSGSAAA
jgi:DNA-binding transcriptional LysR family regulator